MVKDNTDRSFIPIAEEYIKSGMLDDAIAVLKQGLERYPNYLGARVSLGKAYLEKGMISEAMKEFGNVVQVSPDNLFAHKKLAMIYKEAGRIDDAVKACETVLVFSPKDREITELLSNLMSEKIAGMAQYEKPAEQASPVSASMEEPSEINFVSGWEVSEETDTKEDENNPPLPVAMLRSNGSPAPLEKGGEGGFERLFSDEKDAKSADVPKDIPKDIIDELATETLGDLYVAQGEIDKGVDIYRRILEREPGKEQVRSKLADLTDRHRRERQIERLEDFLSRVRKNRG
jgi:tetratricopeptide (TPR) repeat protein